MKFWSDVTKKLYDTQEACTLAERLARKQADEAHEKEKEKAAFKDKINQKRADLEAAMQKVDQCYEELRAARVEYANKFDESASTELDDLLKLIFR